MTRSYPSAASVVWAVLILLAACWAAAGAAFYGFERQWSAFLLVGMVSALSLSAVGFVRSPAAQRAPGLQKEAVIGITPSLGASLCVALTAPPIVLSASAGTSWAVLAAALASAFIMAVFLFGRQRSLIRISKIGLLVVFSVVVFQWPLRISFLAAAPRLEKIATAVRAGARIQTPVQVGVFTIKKVDTRPAANGGQIICLWLTPESGNPSLLAQCRPSGLMFNVSSHTILSSRWQFVTED